jgi:hypothetical protein
MALLKTVKTNFGVDATYWNIFSINEDFKNKILNIVVVGYTSKENRDDNNEPISWKNLELNDDKYIKDATRTLVYDAIKLTDFVDATDC